MSLLQPQLLDTIIHFELRSSLLTCAAAAPGGAQILLRAIHGASLARPVEQPLHIIRLVVLCQNTSKPSLK